MVATVGLRIGVFGATGALGSEVLAALDRSSLHVAEVRAFASDDSLGEDIEFQGSVFPVETDGARFAGLDLVFLCAPPGPSLDAVRHALRAEVPSFDLSGALSLSDEVPLCASGVGAPPPPDAPVVALPPGAALALSLVLRPLADAAGLARVVATLLESASVAGRQGIQTIYAESLAIFNHEEPPEPGVFGRPVAYDCLPGVGASSEGVAAGGEGADEAERREAAVAARVARLLGGSFALTVASVQVPTFVGLGATLAVETERPLDVDGALGAFEKAAGVEVWRGEAPNLRAAASRDTVLVGRLRRDPSTAAGSSGAGLLLWVAADALSLTAAHAVALAEARFAAPCPTSG